MRRRSETSVPAVISKSAMNTPDRCTCARYAISAGAPSACGRLASSHITFACSRPVTMLYTYKQ